MSAEVLTVTPVSGKFPEQHFGDRFDSPLWVKFTDNQFVEWVGCFSQSSSRECLALTSTDNTTGFVVAGGRGYLIDIQERKLIVDLDEYPTIESAIKTTKPDYFLAGTFYSIYVLNSAGLIKEIRPDTRIDGIYLKGQTDNKAFGDLATLENQYSKNLDFELDLITFQLKFLT